MQPHVILNAQSAQDTQVTEQWREIPGSEGRYEVSDHGRVRSYFYYKQWRTEPRILSPFLSNVGYLTYKLVMHGRSSSYSAHRLVMLAFVGPSELTVNHKNGIKTDNNLCNLEYMTRSENLRHSVDILGNQHGVKGEYSPNAKLSDTQVDWLRRLADEGKSNRDLVEIFGVSFNHVSMLKNNKAR